MKKIILSLLPLAFVALSACQPEEEPVVEPQPRNNVLVGHKWRAEFEEHRYGYTFINKNEISITSNDEGMLYMYDEMVGFGGHEENLDIIYSFDESTNKIVLNTPDYFFVENWELYYNPGDGNMYSSDSSTVYYLVE